MESAMKGVKKCYDEWGEVFFVYEGVKIMRRAFWDYIARTHSFWYVVAIDGRSFPYLTDAKIYIKKIKKAG